MLDQWWFYTVLICTVAFVSRLPLAFIFCHYGPDRLEKAREVTLSLAMSNKILDWSICLFAWWKIGFLPAAGASLLAYLLLRPCWFLGQYTSFAVARKFYPGVFSDTGDAPRREARGRNW